jgi:hypothetical protein
MRGVRMLLAVLLAVEALNALLWSSRILSAAPAYSAGVLLMVLLRVLAAALQGTAAWLLTGGAPAAVPLARLAFAFSAVLLVGEVGFRLAPSSLPPGLRMPVVVAYGLYALSCLRGLALIERADRFR